MSKTVLFQTIQFSISTQFRERKKEMTLVKAWIHSIGQTGSLSTNLEDRKIWIQTSRIPLKNRPDGILLMARKLGVYIYIQYALYIYIYIYSMLSLSLCSLSLSLSLSLWILTSRIPLKNRPDGILHMAQELGIYIYIYIYSILYIYIVWFLSLSLFL